MARFCAQCGAEMVDTAAFCPKCGSSTGIASSLARPSAFSTVPSVAAPSEAQVRDHLPAMLAYLFVPAVGFLFVSRYKRNSLVRFHSFQAILLWFLFVIVDLVLAAIPLVNLFLLPVIGIGQLIVGVICMIKAFQGEFFRLPVVGNLSSSVACAD